MALKDDRVEQCLRSCGSEFQMWGPKQEKVRKQPRAETIENVNVTVLLHTILGTVPVVTYAVRHLTPINLLFADT